MKNQNNEIIEKCPQIEGDEFDGGESTRDELEIKEVSGEGCDETRGKRIKGVNAAVGQEVNTNFQSFFGSFTTWGRSVAFGARMYGSSLVHYNTPFCTYFGTFLRVVGFLADQSIFAYGGSTPNPSIFPADSTNNLV